jgi:hypothetical protein
MTPDPHDLHRSQLPSSFARAAVAEPSDAVVAAAVARTRTPLDAPPRRWTLPRLAAGAASVLTLGVVAAVAIHGAVTAPAGREEAVPIQGEPAASERITTAITTATTTPATTWATAPPTPFAFPVFERPEAPSDRLPDEAVDAVRRQTIHLTWPLQPRLLTLTPQGHSLYAVRGRQRDKVCLVLVIADGNMPVGCRGGGEGAMLVSGAYRPATHDPIVVAGLLIGRGDREVTVAGDPVVLTNGAAIITGRSASTAVHIHGADGDTDLTLEGAADWVGGGTPTTANPDAFETLPAPTAMATGAEPAGSQPQPTSLDLLAPFDDTPEPLAALHLEGTDVQEAARRLADLGFRVSYRLDINGLGGPGMSCGVGPVAPPAAGATVDALSVPVAGEVRIITSVDVADAPRPLPENCLIP